MEEKVNDHKRWPVIGSILLLIFVVYPLSLAPVGAALLNSGLPREQADVIAISIYFPVIELVKNSPEPLRTWLIDYHRMWGIR